MRFHGDDQPDVVFTDKGQGFYRLATSKITPEHEAALEEHGLTPFMGKVATRQPGDLKDILLHKKSYGHGMDKQQTDLVNAGTTMGGERGRLRLASASGF